MSGAVNNPRSHRLLLIIIGNNVLAPLESAPNIYIIFKGKYCVKVFSFTSEEKFAVSDVPTPTTTLIMNEL